LEAVQGGGKEKHHHWRAETQFTAVSYAERHNGCRGSTSHPIAASFGNAQFGAEDFSGRR